MISPDIVAARSAFILGGTGQIGRATAERLLRAGWDVSIGGRTEREVPEGAQFVRIDRDEDPLPGGVDLFLDVIPYEERHARQLLELAGSVGSVVAISSASVYCDAQGRTLDEAEGVDDFPDLPVPIQERQRTVPPGDETYSTKKVAVERALLAQDRLPSTVIRACAVYGRGSALPREWYFVKRILDGRRWVPLAHGGRSIFHTTAAENLAELVWLCAEHPATRVLNCGDPDPPTVLEIARTVAAVFEHSWAEVLIEGPPGPGKLGGTPWSTPKPFIVDMLTAELDLRYRPVTRYAKAVEETCRWLVDATRDRDWREVMPDAAGYLGEKFDYAAEDAYLESLRS
jgi:nucleoside-diphosphate-sugar epimerase